MNWVINMRRKKRLTQDEVQELNDFIFCEDLKQLDLEKYKKHTKKLYYKSKKMQDENKQLKEIINEAVEILGEYKHYSTPTEEQNSKNEDVVDKAYKILKGK